MFCEENAFTVLGYVEEPVRGSVKRLLRSL